MAHRVTFKGSRPHRAAWDTMATAKTLCLPSHSESFGLVMIEALAVGTPVIGYAPTFFEIEAGVGMECGVPLESTDPHSIARALSTSLERAWDEISISARARTAFSNEEIVRRYIELFEELEQRRPSR